VSDRSAYYLLANIDEHPEVLPMAYDIATENLAALEIATDLTEFRDRSASLPQLIEHLSQLEEQRQHPWRNPDDAVAMKTARHYGLLASLVFLACACMKRMVYFKVLKGMTLTLDTIDIRCLQPHQKYSGEIVAGDAIRSLISHGSDVSPDFVECAIGRNDWACVFWDGQHLVSSGWYSNQSVPIDEYFSICFSKDYTYMYKGFTHSDYRGEKLHAYGMASALSAVVRGGKNGLISYVEIDNFASLKSCDRLGYKIFGTCIVLRILGKSFVMTTPGCKRFEFGVRERKPDQPSAGGPGICAVCPERTN